MISHNCVSHIIEVFIMDQCPLYTTVNYTLHWVINRKSTLTSYTDSVR